MLFPIHPKNQKKPKTRPNQSPFSHPNSSLDSTASPTVTFESDRFSQSDINQFGNFENLLKAYVTYKKQKTKPDDVNLIENVFQEIQRDDSFKQYLESSNLRKKNEGNVSRRKRESLNRSDTDSLGSFNKKRNASLVWRNGLSSNKKINSQAYVLHKFKKLKKNIQKVGVKRQRKRSGLFVGFEEKGVAKGIGEFGQVKGESVFLNGRRGARENRKWFLGESRNLPTMGFLNEENCLQKNIIFLQ